MPQKNSSTKVRNHYLKWVGLGFQEMSPPSSPMRSKELVECSGLRQCRVARSGRWSARHLWDPACHAKFQCKNVQTCRELL